MSLGARAAQGDDSDAWPRAGLFVMIDAEPNTDWLRDCVELDGKGFVVTGAHPWSSELISSYATSRPGVFAVGDVRAGSVERVASAVGEGSVVVAAIHGYSLPAELAEPRDCSC